MRTIPGASKRIPMAPKLLVGRKKHCAILAKLYPERDRAWLPVHTRRERLHIKVQDFSLIDHPVTVFDTLREIARAEATCAGMLVDFVDGACDDVSSYLIFGLMKQNMIRVIEGGQITPAVCSMLNAVDLARFIGVSSSGDSAKDPTFVPFQLRHRRPLGSSHSPNTAFQPSRAEKYADDLVDTINRWLRVCDRPALTKEMMGYVARLVTEVLDNAVRHSDLVGGDGDWAMAGFLSAWSDPDNPGRVSYVCSLGMVSVGATIYDSLSHCDDDATRARLNYYTSKHGWWQPSARAKREVEEKLTTVFALQDGVSRFSQATGESRGGVGLMDTVQFTNNISVAARSAYEQPAVTIISGNSCIRVRGQYFTAKSDVGKPREIWFNPENTLERPPESDYVLTLPFGFPGTIVALRFCVGNTDPRPTDHGNIT